MYVSSLLLSLCLGALVKDSDGSSDWCYTGCGHSPPHWSSIAGSFCGEKRQSPIDIVTGHAKTDDKLNNFTLDNFSSKHALKYLENNGHTVKCVLEVGAVEVSGGGLNSTYSSAQLHFHWGNTEHHPGSEHTLDGHRYPMEMHIVSLKKGLDVEQAKADSEGIAVLGFFIAETEDADASEPWDAFTSYLTHIPNITNRVNVTHNVSIDELIAGVDLAKFYRYKGSLTTPGCNEAVVWTVFQQPIKISKSLIQRFPSVTGLKNIYRPTQAVNGRSVFASPAIPPPHGHDWCYSDHCAFSPGHWDDLPESHCGGQNQSPIDIQTKDVVEDADLQKFAFTMFDDKRSIVSVTNTGHTVKYDVKPGMEVSGGGLRHVYTLLQFHFHWGGAADEGAEGSEHMVNSKRYPMEMHLVTVRKGFTVPQAVATPNGLAVLGFFIEDDSRAKAKKGHVKSGGGSGHQEAQAEPSPHSASWEKLTSYLSSISDINGKAEVRAEISVADLLGGVDLTSYYRYNGSLTTPSCNEAVVWTVFKDPIKLDKSLIKKFPSSAGYHSVYRPVQMLYSRKVYTTAGSSAPGPGLLVLVACAWASSL